MPGWDTFSSLATAGGTLVLAVATFASVRSANRSAKVAQEALLVQMRPMLIPSRLTDPVQKIFFQEGKYIRLDGGRGAVEFDDRASVVYLAMSLRNAGQGISFIHGWRFMPGRELTHQRPDPGDFRTQGLDLAIAPDDVGFWEAAFRDGNDPQFGEAVGAAKDGELVTIDLLYGDQDGQQRVISRMVLRRMFPEDPDKPEVWLPTVIRHWNLDRPDPRDR
ncbi:MAG: hypothetical protein ACRDOK_10360 [Streptosporangiaceae bacterium]